MISSVEAPVGRRREFEELVELLELRQSALALIEGPPGSGRSHLIGVLGKAAAELGYLCLGTYEPLVLDGTTTLTDVNRVLSALAKTEAASTSLSTSPAANGIVRKLLNAWRDDGEVLALLRGAAPVLVAIEGYAPSPTLKTWFTARLVPDIRQRTPPIVLVVSDRADALTDLRPLAQHSVTLGPLDRTEVNAFLTSVFAGAVPDVGDPELNAYCDAVTTDPGLLSAFETVFAALRQAGQQGRLNGSA
jgi:hypothetical protein